MRVPRHGGFPRHHRRVGPTHRGERRRVDQNAFNDLIREGDACGGTPDGTGIGSHGGRAAWASFPSRSSATDTRSTSNARTRRLVWIRTRCTTRFSSVGRRETAQDARGERVAGRRRRGIFRRADGSGAAVGSSRTRQIPAGVDLNLFRARSYPAARDDTFPAFETSDDPLVALHASLVEAQLRQARAAAAIARALDRVLILPPFLCGLDRVWFPHFGRFPGSQFQLPFVCPLDHVVAVENMDASLVREHSFLSHPEVPEDGDDPRRRRRATAGDGEADGANATWVDFPSDVACVRAGRGRARRRARREGDVRLGGNRRRRVCEKKTRENCRRRRRRRGRERSDRGTRGRAHERGVAPRYRRAVHERRMARERRAARMARGAGRRYPGRRVVLLEEGTQTVPVKRQIDGRCHTRADAREMCAQMCGRKEST